jgi:hypothetical protein
VAALIDHILDDLGKLQAAVEEDRMVLASENEALRREVVTLKQELARIEESIGRVLKK